MRGAKDVEQETIAHITQVSGPQVSEIENGEKRATRAFGPVILLSRAALRTAVNSALTTR
ncbi:hypothetical protein ACQEU6_28165 [Spirillospora sp. CA-108201]